MAVSVSGIYQPSLFWDCEYSTDKLFPYNVCFVLQLWYKKKLEKCLPFAICFHLFCLCLFNNANFIVLFF